MGRITKRKMDGTKFLRQQLRAMLEAEDNETFSGAYIKALLFALDDETGAVTRFLTTHNTDP